MSLSTGGKVAIAIFIILVVVGIAFGVYYLLKKKEVCEGANDDGLCPKGTFKKYVEDET